MGIRIRKESGFIASIEKRLCERYSIGFKTWEASGLDKIRSELDHLKDIEASLSALKQEDKIDLVFVCTKVSMLFEHELETIRIPFLYQFTLHSLIKHELLKERRRQKRYIKKLMKEQSKN